MDKVNSTTVDNWLSPLQKHIRNGKVEFITIKVRIFGDDMESDFCAKFDEGPLTAEKVCNAVAERQGLSENGKKVFALWIIGRDIELQLRPKHNLFQLMENWNKWVEKYTHFPEANNPAHPICKHWFVFRKEALDSTPVSEYEENALTLLYGEAYQNIQSSRYPCTVEDIVNLSALQLQTHGDYNSISHTSGYLVEQDRWLYLVPLKMRKKLSAKTWGKRILEAYARHVGKSQTAARKRYLEYVRKFPFNGNSFFPCCQYLPPGAYFEMRQQHHLFGVGADGISILDQDKNKLLFHCGWKNLVWQFNDDNIVMWVLKEGTTINVDEKKKQKYSKQFEIITPQAAIIQNVIERAIHLTKKEETPLNLTYSTRDLKSLNNTTSSLANNRFKEARLTRMEKARSYITDIQKVNGITIIDEDKS
ncbi:FERM domain-containing protein 8 [Lobulomyces angularis]|nr:FERM domain-containing protein 8 [Lobulomyces angularis]